MHGRLKPNRSASAGATGNIYEMSFEYERLKKIKINAIQMTSSKAGLKPLGWRGISSARRMLRHQIETPGRTPAMMTGTKKKKAPGRCCSGDRKRRKCWTKKKNSKKAG